MNGKDGTGMVNWIVDKTSKVPLYLQLRDLIKYYISTGAIRANERLPTLDALGKELGVNFETVRKAYKDLEKEGLITTRRGKGTFVDGHIAPVNSTNAPVEQGPDNIAPLRNAVRQLLHSGMELDQVKRTIDELLSSFSQEFSEHTVIFAECNQLQVREISETLRSHLNMRVRAVFLDQLKEEIDRANSEGCKLLAVITTGFHMNEVRRKLEDVPVVIDFVVTNMSPETRRELDAFSKETRFGFVCRDRESIYFKEILKADLQIESDFTFAVMEDSVAVDALLASVDVLLVTPTIYDQIKLKASTELPVFNVFDRVDPTYLFVLKERMLDLRLRSSEASPVRKNTSMAAR